MGLLATFRIESKMVCSNLLRLMSSSEVSAGEEEGAQEGETVGRRSKKLELEFGTAI